MTKKFTYIVAHESGIHARPAGIFVNFAKNIDDSVNIFIRFNDKIANGRSLFEIMALCLKQGDTIEISLENNLKYGDPKITNDELELASIEQKLLNFLQENHW